MVTLAMALGAAVSAQAAPDTSYPTKPVRIIVSFSPGGPNDLMAADVRSEVAGVEGAGRAGRAGTT